MECPRKSDHDADVAKTFHLATQTTRTYKFLSVKSKILVRSYAVVLIIIIIIINMLMMMMMMMVRIIMLRGVIDTLHRDSLLLYAIEMLLLTVTLTEIAAN